MTTNVPALLRENVKTLFDFRIVGKSGHIYRGQISSIDDEWVKLNYGFRNEIVLRISEIEAVIADGGATVDDELRSIRNKAEELSELIEGSERKLENWRPKYLNGFRDDEAYN